MGSMFAKLQQQKNEDGEVKLFMRDIVQPNDERYFVCTDSETGKMLAIGNIEFVKQQLGTDYTTRPIKYHTCDKITETVKVLL